MFHIEFKAFNNNSKMVTNLYYLLIITNISIFTIIEINLNIVMQWLHL